MTSRDGKNAQRCHSHKQLCAKNRFAFGFVIIKAGFNCCLSVENKVFLDY